MSTVVVREKIQRWLQILKIHAFIAITLNQKDIRIMKYPLVGVRKLLSESEQGGELYFKTSVVPSRNRFQISNDTTTYEWNADEDILVPRYNMQYYSCTWNKNI